MEQLLRMLTTDTSLDLPPQCVIEAVTFQPHIGAKPICSVTAKDKKRTVVTMSNELGTLIVSLRVLRRLYAVRQEPMGRLAPNALHFTKEDVVNFVNIVHDTNYIHRESPYVVPGLLILKTTYAILSMNRHIDSFSIRYHAPMIVGDQVVLTTTTDDCTIGDGHSNIEIQNNEYQVRGHVGDTILFTITFK